MSDIHVLGPQHHTFLKVQAEEQLNTARQSFSWHRLNTHLRL